MKLIRIGSSPSCDIVLNDPYVSSLHAEITILDNGEIVLEDKNSSNGTFVGTQKITPNSEITVRRGDFVRLAKTPLPWARIPAAANLSKFKQVVNIGSNFRNEISVNSGTVSRYHATLKVDKSGKVFICDNGSRNGTKVNGIAIPANKDVRVKKGDNIMVADEDITEQVNQYLPGGIGNFLIPIAASLVIVALLGIQAIIWPKPWISAPPVDAYQPAVVYIHAAYHYEIKVEGISFRWPVDNDEHYISSSTGFFVDKEGRIGTARHCAVPWEEQYSKETHDELKKLVRNAIFSFLPAQVTTPQELAILRSSGLGEKIYQEATSLVDMNRILSEFRTGAMKIEGVMDFLAVGYSGNNYENNSEFERCTLVAASDDPKKDVALLQLNKKRTPAEIKYIFDLSKVTNKPLKPMADELYTIGYPHGFQWSYEKNNKELKNSIRSTRCSKIPNKYDFEFQASSQPGASGSPVFLKNGQLVGILSSIYGETGPTKAAHAYFMKQLYDDNIGAFAK